MPSNILAAVFLVQRRKNFRTQSMDLTSQSEQPDDSLTVGAPALLQPPVPRAGQSLNPESKADEDAAQNKKEAAKQKKAAEAAAKKRRADEEAANKKNAKEEAAKQKKAAEEEAKKEAEAAAQREKDRCGREQRNLWSLFQ